MFFSRGGAISVAITMFSSFVLTVGYIYFKKVYEETWPGKFWKQILSFSLPFDKEIFCVKITTPRNKLFYAFLRWCANASYARGGAQLSTVKWLLLMQAMHVVVPNSPQRNGSCWHMKLPSWHTLSLYYVKPCFTENLHADSTYIQLFSLPYP